MVVDKKRRASNRLKWCSTQPLRMNPRRKSPVIKQQQLELKKRCSSSLPETGRNIPRYDMTSMTKGTARQLRSHEKLRLTATQSTRKRAEHIGRRVEVDHTWSLNLLTSLPLQYRARLIPLLRGRPQWGTVATIPFPAAYPTAGNLHTGQMAFCRSQGSIHCGGATEPRRKKARSDG